MTIQCLNKLACSIRFAISLGVIVAFSAVLGTASAEEIAFTWKMEDSDLEWVSCPDFMPEGCVLSVLQGNPEEPNADVFFRMPGNSVVDRHWHRSAERMVLVSGEMHVNYDGQEPVVLEPGTYAYGPPELPHVTECQSSEPCVLFIAFEEPVDAMAGAPE